MSWAIGYDNKWKRDIGYGVPAYCDFPGCMAEIDRGLSHVCGGQPYGGDEGCGLYFCGRHLKAWQEIHVCERCLLGKPVFSPTRDHPRWNAFKRTDPSWAAWRAEHPDFMANLTPLELCQQKLLALQSAVDEHTTEMDALMRKPASYDRGREIGNLTNLLSQARRDSASTCAVSAPTTSLSSAAPKPTASTRPVPSSSTASSIKRPSKRKRR